MPYRKMVFTNYQRKAALDEEKNKIIEEIRKI
jgi:hypothetical protein